MPESRPIPEADLGSAPFYDGLRHGKLLIQRCRVCGAFQLGREICYSCFSDDLDWRPASGNGVVHSFVVMHVLYHPAFASDIPYNVGSVELDEGPRLFANIRDIAAADLRIGLKVRVQCVEIAPGAFTPAFVPFGNLSQGIRA